MATFLNTLYASILVLGWIKFGIIVIIDLILWRIHPLIGLAGLILLIAYLAHWI